jgi:hypothetical protein
MREVLVGDIAAGITASDPTAIAKCLVDCSALTRYQLWHG